MSNIIRNIYAPDDKQVLLDIGCGTGCNVSFFSKYWNTIGIDTSEYGLELAKLKYPNCNFMLQNIFEVPGDLWDSVGCITIMDVLEHVEDDIGFLNHIVSNIKVGCKIVITVPALMELWSPHDVSSGHYRRYTTKSFMNLIDNPNLKCLLANGMNYRLYPIVRLARIISSSLYRHLKIKRNDVTMPNVLLNSVLYNIFHGENKSILKHLASNNINSINQSVSIVSVLVKT